GLKDVGGYLGCSWTEADASGIQSMAWRMHWEATRGEAWKRTLLTYNLEDCAALRRVTEFISAARDGAKQMTEPTPANQISPVFERVQDADELPGAGAWRRGLFSHPDFKYINQCAYFDYQRERVYVRTNRRLKEK